MAIEGFQSRNDIWELTRKNPAVLVKKRDLPNPFVPLISARARAVKTTGTKLIVYSTMLADVPGQKTSICAVCGLDQIRRVSS